MVTAFRSVYGWCIFRRSIVSEIFVEFSLLFFFCIEKSFVCRKCWNLFSGVYSKLVNQLSRVSRYCR